MEGNNRARTGDDRPGSSLNAERNHQAPNLPSKEKPVNNTDTQWGMVLVCGTAEFFANAMHTTSSLFYVYFMDAFTVNREIASWPSNAMSVASSCAGVIVTLLQQRLGVFSIGMIGSVLLWASLIASAIAPGIEVLATCAAINGIGLEFLENMMMVTVGTYFLKHRSLAMELRGTGYTAAALIFPTIVSTLHSALSPVIIAVHLGINHVSITSGAAGLLTSPMHLATPFITGFFRDHMGSYDNLIRLLAGLAAFAALLGIPLIVTGQKRGRYDMT